MVYANGTVTLAAGTSVTISGTVTTIPAATTWYGNMTLAAATSTTVASGNMTNSSGTVPTTAAGFARLFIFNSGSAPAQICWLANTCSASAGETLAAGASDVHNVTGTSQVPAVYSAIGTSIFVSN